MVSPDDMRNRLEQWYKNDFFPVYPEGSPPSAEVRSAAAIEYIAHHIGKISRNLDRLANTLENQKR